MNDRDQIIAELEYMKRDVLEDSDKDKTLDKAIAMLKEQEGVEQKTGRWIYESHYCEAWSNICSECGKRMSTAINTYASYCWNCGAKMEGR